MQTIISKEIEDRTHSKTAMDNTKVPLNQTVLTNPIFMDLPGSPEVLSDYSFASTSGTYTALSSETTLWTTAFDEEISSSITIPGFTMDGTAYTTLYVSANGFITLGATPPTLYDMTPISSTSAYSRVISGFGQDLQNAGSGTPKISYNTNDGGEIVVQFQDVRRWLVTGEILSFQIRLNPTTGNIKIVYGGTITGGTSADYPQVGLRGASNSYYSNRTTTSNWSATTAGGSNIATCTFSPTVKPVAGQTFTWSLTGPSSPTNFTATPVSSAQINLGWVLNGAGNNVMVAWNTANTFGTPSGTYTVDAVITGGGTVIYNSNGTSYNHTGRNPNTAYYYKAWSVDGTNTYSSGTIANAMTFCATTVAPFTQNFESAIFPPTCWTLVASGDKNWARSTSASGYGTGTASAKMDFANFNPGINPDLITNTFDISGFTNPVLKFDHAYATFIAENDQLEILYSENNGSSYTRLVIYDGGVSGPLNTGGAVSSGNFIPTAGHGATKTIVLPASTNKIKFHAISANGNDLFIDNIKVEEAPTNPVFSIYPASKTLNDAVTGGAR